MRYSFPMIIPVAIERVYIKLLKWYYRLMTSFLVWQWGIERGRDVTFQGKTIIRSRKYGEICVGKGVVFNSNVITNLVGLSGPTILDTRGGGRINIGSNSGFSSVVMSSRTLIRIGNNVKVGGNVRIFDHDFHSLDSAIRCTSEDRKNIRSKEIVIGDDCFIGTNSILLKGTEIGARSIVAAGSVVFGLKIPPDSLVKGNPAQIIRR